MQLIRKRWLRSTALWIVLILAPRSIPLNVGLGTVRALMSNYVTSFDERVIIMEISKDKIIKILSQKGTLLKWLLIPTLPAFIRIYHTFNTGKLSYAVATRAFKVLGVYGIYQCGSVTPYIFLTDMWSCEER